MMYIGIDPGVSGGIAILSAAGGPVAAVKMPETERDLLDFLEGYAPNHPRGGPAVDSRAMLEHVSASPQMGVVSAFTFGQGIGRLRMALTAGRIPFDSVTSGKWQAAMGCRSAGDKNVTKRRAQQLFPALTVTHAIADALLLAEYCRRLHTGVLTLPPRASKGTNGKEKRPRSQASAKGHGQESRQSKTRFTAGRRQTAKGEGGAAAGAGIAGDGAGPGHNPRSPV